MKNQHAVAMLLAALFNAEAYKTDMVPLLDAGMKWANAEPGSDAEESAWKAVELAAGWVWS